MGRWSVVNCHGRILGTIGANSLGAEFLFCHGVFICQKVRPLPWNVR